MPARHIPPRHLYVSGRVASSKATGPQAFESLLEQDFLLMLEFDRGIRRYASQPITIRWNEDGRRRRYTPDVLAEYTEITQTRFPHLKNTLFEVKPEAILKRDWYELKPKFKAAIRWTREFDCRFRIVTERHIRTPYLNNIKFLLQYRNERFRYVSNGEIGERQAMLRAALFELSRTTPKGLLSAVSHDKDDQVKLIPYIWYLINCNVIGVDLHQPLNMESAIWSLENGTMLAALTAGKYRSRILDILEKNGVEYELP